MTDELEVDPTLLTRICAALEFLALGATREAPDWNEALVVLEALVVEVKQLAREHVPTPEQLAGAPEPGYTFMTIPGCDKPLKLPLAVPDEPVIERHATQTVRDGLAGDHPGDDAVKFLLRDDRPLACTYDIVEATEKLITAVRQTSLGEKIASESHLRVMWTDANNDQERWIISAVSAACQKVDTRKTRWGEKSHPWSGKAVLPKRSP